MLLLQRRERERRAELRRTGRSDRRGPRLRTAVPSASPADRPRVPVREAPGRGWGARAACGPQRSHARPPAGTSRARAREDAGSPKWDTPPFWARRSPRNELSAGRAVVGGGLGPVRPAGGVLDGPGNPSPSPCFFLAGSRGPERGEGAGGRVPPRRNLDTRGGHEALAAEEPHRRVGEGGAVKSGRGVRGTSTAPAKVRTS